VESLGQRVCWTIAGLILRVEVNYYSYQRLRSQRLVGDDAESDDENERDTTSSPEALRPTVEALQDSPNHVEGPRNDENEGNNRFEKGGAGDGGGGSGDNDGDGGW